MVLGVNMTYTTEQRGASRSTDYKLYFRNSDCEPISPFHDIPLKASDGVYNMIVEVPRWSNAKMEIATKEPLNPIKQDIKKGKLRYVHNCFPHKGYIWNYGALPQTWENPLETDHSTGCKGDNDPIDVCEIGHTVRKTGDVVQVKVLGVLAMIDEGETDWKIIAIDITDPLAAKLNDIGDVEQNMPGFLKATHEWFRIYKMPDGKPANQFAFDGEFKDREFATKIIDETAHYWQLLMNKTADVGGLSLTNTKVGGESTVSAEQANQIIAENPEASEGPEIDQSVNTWHYVHLQKL